MCSDKNLFYQLEGQACYFYWTRVRNIFFTNNFIKQIKNNMPYIKTLPL